MVSDKNSNLNLKIDAKKSKEEGNDKSSIRFTNLVKGDEDLQSIISDIENCWSSPDISSDEKLRLVLLALRQTTVPTDDTFKTGTSIKEFIVTFTGLLQKHFDKVVNLFSEYKRSYRPLIKMIQLFEVMHENFKDHAQHKDNLLANFQSIVNGFKQESDWRYLRKLHDQGECIKIEGLPSQQDLVLLRFLTQIENFKKILIWKTGRNCWVYVEKVLDNLLKLKKNKPEIFFQSVMRGRFDKDPSLSINSSLIIGDEGGLFLLLNSIRPKSEEEQLIEEAGVSEEYLNEKRNAESSKVILGEGSFGKVRLALSIFGNLKVDIGQLVCVKKSFSIGEAKDFRKKTNTLGNITDSCFEDFFVKKLTEAVYAPKSLDMAILSNKYIKDSHRKAYLVMEIVPQDTADKAFAKPEYQKWEYQKPFIIEILKTMEGLLRNERIFNSDLKPQNALFDPLSRKTAIIDLGSSLYIERNLDVKHFDISVGGFGMTEKYCPPEISRILTSEDENIDSHIDLEKSISYLCGITIAEVTSIETNKKDKKNVENWLCLAEKTDLKEEERKKLEGIVRGLIDKDAAKRLSTKQAMEKIHALGSEVDFAKVAQEQYVQKARIKAAVDPSALSLNSDINSTRTKGIIDQYLIKSNPKYSKKEAKHEINQEFAEFFEKKDEIVFVLLGEAGSGKSLSLQLKFLEDLDSWEPGKPLPIFFNLANEVELERIFRRINTSIGCNLSPDSPTETAIHLFIDSYDEGAVKNSSQEDTIVQSYIKNLKNAWKNIKIIISCRTDFVQKLGEDNLEDFKPRVENSAINGMRARYIAPIGYGDNINNSLKQLVSSWLHKEQSQLDPETILKKITKQGLQDRMNTGLMFNMIMKMLITENPLALDDDHSRPLGFQIYKNSIKQELALNWELLVISHRPAEKIQVLTEEISNHPNLSSQVESSQTRDLIFIGLEDLAEKIASYLLRNDINRLNFHQIKTFLHKQPPLTEPDDLRIEWTNLYHICRILGLKMENHNHQNQTVDQAEAPNQHLNIGFRHETYKNYFLLRGFKRFFSTYPFPPNTIHNTIELEALSAVLHNHKTCNNFQLLRFFAEEIQFRDEQLRHGLRQILTDRQNQSAPLPIQQQQQPNQNPSVETDPLTQLFNLAPNSQNQNPTAAVVISLLVAASYSFSGQDLSHLDLTGAYLRGGIFEGATFQKTILRRTNFRHVNIDGAKFLQADLRELYLGLWPDLIGHGEGVNSVSFTADGKRLASASTDRLVKIWDPATGECVQSLKGHSDQATSISFSKDGKRLASGSRDKSIKIWDTVTGECVQTLIGHSDWVECVSFFSGDNRLGSGSGDQSIKIWDLVTGECVQTLTGHSNRVKSISFRSDGKKVSSGSGDSSSS
jgi:serine/threonine protein kinase